MNSVEGIFNEPSVDFVGKDGFFWWVGEVEDNEDPMELGRVKCRVLGYYTNFRGGTTADLLLNFAMGNCITTYLSNGNDGHESTGQLQLVLLLWVSLWMVKLDRCQQVLFVRVQKAKSDKECKRVFIHRI